MASPMKIKHLGWWIAAAAVVLCSGARRVWAGCLPIPILDGISELENGY